MPPTHEDRDHGLCAPYARATRRESGFSLAEIMIALSLGLIVVAGLGQIYVAGRSANRIIDSNSRLNEHGRFAMEYLARAARFAGYFSCADSHASIRNVVDGDLFWLKHTNGAEAFRVGANTLPTAIAEAANPLTDTDVLVVRFADVRQTAEIAEGDINNTEGIISFTQPHFFNAGDIAVLNTAACDQTTFFQVTSASNSDGSYAISFANDNAVTPGNCTTELEGAGHCNNLSGSRNLTNFDTAELNRFVTQAYFVADDPTGCMDSAANCPGLQDCPTLFTAGAESGFDQSGKPHVIPVLRNVTDLQVDFGIYDSSTTNQAEPQTTQYVASTALLDWDDVVSLRLTLQIRSELANDAGECPSTNFSTTVYFRNAPSATPGRRPILY